MDTYSYDRRPPEDRAARLLSEWGLEGLSKGAPVTLYHGTTRLFRHFKLEESRTELVNKFYGSGVFLTPSKRVAERYAEANRNMGFPPSIIEVLRQKNPNAGRFLEMLYKYGLSEAWDMLPAEFGTTYGEGFSSELNTLFKGVDPNDLGDISQYIIGTKVRHQEGGNGLDELMSIFHGGPTGTPEWAYDILDRLGIDSKTYRPKVYTVAVTCHNPLVTANKAQARAARRKGYDCVVFYGSDLVENVPEVAVYDPSAVRVSRIEVV